VCGMERYVAGEVSSLGPTGRQMIQLACCPEATDGPTLPAARTAHKYSTS